jgi:hypothetical protein
LVVDLNRGLRNKELRELRWRQIDLVHKKQLTAGKSKTHAGTGRVIPLNDTVMIALEAHAAWYIRRFGQCKPEWYVFPAGKGQPNDPTRPVTTLRTAWTKVRKEAKVVGRWHDNRHTLVTELAESGAGDEVIMSIAGHVSRAMLSRYSHVRMEAKRRALDEIATRQRAADEKREQEAEKRRQQIGSDAMNQHGAALVQLRRFRTMRRSVDAVAPGSPCFAFSASASLAKPVESRAGDAQVLGGLPVLLREFLLVVDA